MNSVWPQILNSHMLRYNHPESNGDPDYVIMDVSWLERYWPTYGLFLRFSLKDLIELVTNVNMECDYDPVVWETIGSLLDEEEEKTFDFQTASFVIESVIELFYQELHYLTLKSESTYLFFRWADRSSIILKRDR